MRVGLGYDIHKLKKGRKLFLGGIEIPYEKGLEGHSDADVLLHAISDALLGAAGLYDIGRHFPDTDMKYKDVSSLVLLKEVMVMVKNKGLSVGNIDSVVIAEDPKISPYVDRMKNAISSALEIDENKINIKATSNEGVDAIGTGQAIAAHAIAALIFSPPSLATKND